MKKGIVIMPEKKQPRQRRTYTPEFKQQLVDLYHNGKRKCDIIREYDIGSWDIIGHDCCGEEHDWHGVQLSQGQTITLNNTGKDGSETMNMK